MTLIRSKSKRCESMSQLVGVNALLTVFLLTPVLPYSSEVQQPMLATAVLGKRPRTRWAALFDREQWRAGSLHPGGLAVRLAPLITARSHVSCPLGWSSFGSHCVAELSRTGSSAVPVAPWARRQRLPFGLGGPGRRTPGHTARTRQINTA
jgi:hypothetical protein